MGKTPVGESSISQQKALAIIPRIISFLSLLCSLYIIGDIWRMAPAKRKLYHRILLGMSISDFSSSVAWFFTTWPIPPDVLRVWGARGTQQTCSLQGFFAQTSIATVIYSGCLALFYYLVIRKGWTHNRLARSHIEYAMHGVAISFALGTSCASVVMGLMNPIGWDCWIASVPLDCEESWLHGGQSTCVRGDNANLFQWIFFYIPLWLTIFFVTFIMVSIVRKFWMQNRRNEAHRVQSLGKENVVQLRSRSGQKKMKELALQSLLYVGTFYITWMFPTILRVTEVTGDLVYYHWVQLSAAFVPSQGIWNLIVYLRPRFSKIRDARLHEQTKINRHPVTPPTTADRSLPSEQQHQDNSHDLSMIAEENEHEVSGSMSLVRTNSRGSDGLEYHDAVQHHEEEDAGAQRTAERNHSWPRSMETERDDWRRRQRQRLPPPQDDQSSYLFHIPQFFRYLTEALWSGDGGAGVEGILESFVGRSSRNFSSSDLANNSSFGAGGEASSVGFAGATVIPLESPSPQDADNQSVQSSVGTSDGLFLDEPSPSSGPASAFGRTIPRPARLAQDARHQTL